MARFQGRDITSFRPADEEHILNIQSIRPRTAASPSIQSVSHITSCHGDNPKKGCSNDVHMLRHAQHTPKVKL